MALDRGLATGRTVGTIYAWGAAGSIVGTFITGYLLINWLGSVAIVWTIAAVLLVMSFAHWMRRRPVYLFGLLFVSALILALAPWPWARKAGAALALREQLSPNTIYQDESQYCYIAVEQVVDHPGRRVFMQDKLKHSEIILGNILNLQYFYTRIYAALTHYLKPERSRLSVLIIGGGGYVFPRYVEKVWPLSLIDVVEIDPAVTKAALNAFGLKKDTSIRTFHMDARNFADELLLRQDRSGPNTLYDFIYGDAFNDYSVPYQLTTREFNDKIFRLLTDQGVYLINVIDVFNSGKFLGAVINTLEQTFPYVYVFSEAGQPRSGRCTFVIAASKQLIDVVLFQEAYKSNLRTWCLDKTETDDLKIKAHHLVLTDDYAPVENLLAPVVRQNAGYYLARSYKEQADELARRGKLDEAITYYKLFLRTDPTRTVQAYDNISRLLYRQGRFEEEVAILRQAIEHNRQAEYKASLGEIHFNLAMTLRDHLGKNSEAFQEFENAMQDYQLQLRDHPDDPFLWTKLGHACAENNRFAQAAEAFKQALDLNPDDVLAYVNLAKALEIQQRFEEAIAVLGDGAKIMLRQGRKEASADLNKLRELLEIQKQNLK